MPRAPARTLGIPRQSRARETVPETVPETDGNHVIVAQGITTRSPMKAVIPGIA